MRWIISSSSALETEQIGESLGKTLIGGDIIALVGELGAGKTVLTKGIARGLGYKEEFLITSPTYVLIREYPGRLCLYHFDFYRLNSIKEIEGLGYEEYFDGEGVSVIEWAEKFASLFPKKTLWIKLWIIGENERRLELNSGDKRWEEPLKQVLKGLKFNQGGELSWV